jgi:hypothetical protein
VNLNEGVVDGDNVDVVVLNSIAEDDTADTTETVDANLDGSHDSGDDVSRCRGDWQQIELSTNLKRGRWADAMEWMQMDAEKWDAGTYTMVY